MYGMSPMTNALSTALVTAPLCLIMSSMVTEVVCLKPRVVLATLSPTRTMSTPAASTYMAVG